MLCSWLQCKCLRNTGVLHRSTRRLLLVPGAGEQLGADAPWSLLLPPGLPSPLASVYVVWANLWNPNLSFLVKESICGIPISDVQIDLWMSDVMCWIPPHFSVMYELFLGWTAVVVEFLVWIPLSLWCMNCFLYGLWTSTASILGVAGFLFFFVF
jgi:hypothetical protein